MNTATINPPLHKKETTDTHSAAQFVGSTIKFAEVLLKELRRRGIKRVFGVPGRENASILFNEVDGIEYITTRVEFTAGIMADFTGRLTRKPQVCFSTMGPGATNMTTAVASAMLNHSPMIFISAQLESDDKFYNLTHQCVDQAGVMKPITKWSYELQSAADLPWAIDQAFKLATSEPAGPVHLAIPTDFFGKPIRVKHDIERVLPQCITGEKGEPDPFTLDAIYEMLVWSKHPLCLVGEGTLRVGAEQAVLNFCRQWNIPFVTAANGKGLAPFDDPLNYGAASPYMEGILGYPALQEIYTPIDLLICIGYQYVDDLLPKMWAHGQPKRLITISSHAIREIHSKFASDINIVGNIPALLKDISIRGIWRKVSRPLNELKAVYRSIVEEQATVDGRLTPIQVLDVVNRNFGDGILCTDIGYYRHHAILFSNPPGTGRFFTDAGLSSFGSGLPAAIAAQMEYPDRQVILVCGDGGFHSGSGDLETLVRYALPVIVIVLNNSAFELIELYQKRNNKVHNPKIAKLGKVDFVKLARANGCEGVFADSVEALESAIRGHDRRVPLVIEVPMEYRDRDSFRESF